MRTRGQSQSPYRFPASSRIAADAGGAGTHDIDVIQIADVDRGLRARAGPLQSELKKPRIRLFDAHDVRVEDDIERLG